VGLFDVFTRSNLSLVGYKNSRNVAKGLELLLIRKDTFSPASLAWIPFRGGWC